MAGRSVDSDMSNSRRAFEELIWPEINEKWFDGAELEPVEEENDSLKHAMDTVAGVDYWSVGDQLEPIASRVQNQHKDISTFTIRMDRRTPGSGINTEFQKRLQSINNGGLSPKWAIQAYISADKIDRDGEVFWVLDHANIKNVALAKEDELIEWCDDGSEGQHFGQNGTGNNEYAGENEDFYYVHWRDYSRFRWLDTLKEPSVQVFAQPFRAKYDPKTKEPVDGQSTLFESVDD